MYDLIDKNLKNYYIKGHKYMFLIGLSLSLVLIILSIFYIVALVYLVICVIITSIFFITWNKNKRKYGKRLSYTNDAILIYNYKNIKINEFKMEYLKKKYIKIAFDECPRFNFKNCLILYLNFEPYENMEYSSYWNDSNIVIIQNSELINNIIKIIK